MNTVKLYFSGKHSDKTFYNYDNDDWKNIYLNKSYHSKYPSHSRNDYITCFWIDGKIFRDNFRYNNSIKKWISISSIVSLSDICTWIEHINTYTQESEWIDF